MHRILFVFFILSLLTGCNRAVHVFNVKDGRIDLSTWNIEEKRIVSLNGEWEFYWNKLLTPDDFKKNNTLKPHYVPVPAIWNTIKIDNRPLSYKGYATYRLKMILPEINKVYAIRTNTLISAYKMWVNGELINEVGVVSSQLSRVKANWKPSVRHFYITSEETEIVIQIANNNNTLGGFWTPISIGSSIEVSEFRDFNITIDNLMLGLLLFMSLYYFSFFLVRRNEKNSLWFSVLCFLMAVGILILGEQRMIFSLMDPFVNTAWRLGQLQIYIAAAVLFLFVHTSYPDEIFEKIYRYTKVYVVFMVIMTFILPDNWRSHIIVYFAPIVSIFFMLMSIVILFRAFLRKEEMASYFLVSIVFLVAPIVNDILNLYNVISTGFFSSYGFTSFVFFQSILLIRRFGLAFNMSESLTVELSKAKDNLEKKVIKRTRELDHDRKLLKDRNEIIEKELELARNIQKAFIPVAPPNQNISFYYEPMEQVGGDFFDFMQLPDAQKLGVFISDVSGHGVPAAFITSMLKSYLKKSGSYMENPNDLLSYLNDSLIKHTADYFITAFYCIYDSQTHTLSYSNAGHHEPFLVTKDEILPLPTTKRAMPLSIYHNSDLESFGKLFNTESYTVEPGNKLIFFTDGLIEARAGISNNEMFGDKELFDAISENQGLNGQDFIKAITDRLAEYTGTTSLEDDLCIICIDV